MSLLVLAAVLTAAFLDALQHYLIKSGEDPRARALAVALAGGMLAAPILLATGLPAPAAWPILMLSATLGTAYWLALGWAYQGGTLAMVFPLSRGSAVLMTALGGHFILQDRLSLSQNVTLCLMMLGLGLVAFSLRPKGQVQGTSLLPSACLAVITAAFTLVDAAGVRLAGSPLAYCAALYIGNAIGVGLATLLWHQDSVARLQKKSLPGIFASALLSLLAYALILFGLQHGPVAIVAALAETSILFAALLGIFWLREATSPSHSIGLTAIAAAVILLRLDFWVTT